MKTNNILRAGLVFLTIGLILTFSENIEAQTTLTFSDLPPNRVAGESYVEQGVLFSSSEGVPMIVRDNLVSGKYGLCSEAKREFMGVMLNTCQDTYIGFVSPDEKMVSNLASGIKIKLLAVGGVTAYWRDIYGELFSSEGSLDANLELNISVPNETFGILLMPSDPDCAMCNFMITGLTFTLSKTPDRLCGKQVADADFAFSRLLNENYSDDVYRKLDEFRKRDGSLDIGLQYLKGRKITFYDEFAIIVRFPPSDLALPQKVFRAMRRKLDEVGLGAGAKSFQEIGEFSFFEPEIIRKRPNGLPQIGDIYHVNIAGPEDGDVMITYLQEHPEGSRFRYSTLTNNLPAIPRVRESGAGSHPNNGSREYGYSREINGWVKFYVRGVDQFYASEVFGSVIVGGTIMQGAFWLSFLEGIGDLAKFYQGKVIYPARKTIDGKYFGLPKCHVPPRKGYGR